MVLDPTLLEINPPGPGLFTQLPSDLPAGEQLLWYWLPRRPLDQLHAHLSVALLNIQAKRERLDWRWSYYLGRHSERVLSPKLRDVMLKSEPISSMFTNYCALAVEAPLSRLAINGWKGDDSACSMAEELWEDNDLDVEGEEVHRHVLLAGEAYVIVWPSDEAMPAGAEPVQSDLEAAYDILLQDARNMYVHYTSRRRRDRAWAAKVWLDEDANTATRTWRATLFYPDEIVRMMVPGDITIPSFAPRNPLAFQIDPFDPGGPHAFGQVPVIRFSRSWDGRSKLDDLIPIQDRINKLTADKIVAAEFGAFPQRWALTNDDPPQEALRAGPGAVWVIPPVSTSPDSNQDAPTAVGQFATTELGNYDNTILGEVQALFTVGQLPRHLLVNPGVAPSAEAVVADEGPMVANVRGYLRSLAASWRDVMQLCGCDVEPVWQDPEAHNELTSAQTFQALTVSGMPLDMAGRLAMDLAQEDLNTLGKLPLPPQPGAAVPGQQAGVSGGGGSPDPDAGTPPARKQGAKSGR